MQDDYEIDLNTNTAICIVPQNDNKQFIDCHMMNVSVLLKLLPFFYTLQAIVCAELTKHKRRSRKRLD